MQKFYRRFIKPLSTEPDRAERELVLNYLLLGIICLAIIALLDTVLQYVFTQQNFLLGRIASIVITVFVFVGLYLVSRYKGLHTSVAIMLTTAIGLLAVAMLYQWGLLVPTGIALCSLAIVMGGILISARYSLYVALAILATLVGLQYAQATGHWQPDLHWMQSPSTAGDVIGFGAIFFTIALVSWLFNRQMELSLRKALRSEKALQRQKDLLEVKVEKRARQLEAAQLEKMQELYRFAELGRLSTALFHDLANHMASVSVDIEGLGAKNQSDIMRRISQNITHIDTIVQRVRKQIRGKHTTEVFSVSQEIEEVISILEPTAKQARVKIECSFEPTVKANLLYKGDVVRFRQIILNLVCNAIEAYPATRSADAGTRVVAINVSRQRTTVTIKVSDHGQGIKPADLANIFKPFFTTKEKGAGVGLFLVKQIVEDDFKGSLQARSDNDSTVFGVDLPKSYYAARDR